MFRPLVVVVDDDVAIQRLVELLLSESGYELRFFSSAEDCLANLSALMPDALCLDITMPGMNGIEALQRIRATHRLLPVLMLTADTSVDTVVTAMNLGAYDYIPKPIEHAKLVTTLRNAVEHARLTMRLTHLEREAEGRGYAKIIGDSPKMKELFRQLDRLATTDITVLIHGESGSGKELVARAIHENSGRSNGPFVALNCAAIPETLQEAELFGHEKGAFTGATGRRVGRFEQAHGGTLFLDEIAELAPSAQAKLLRVLQERLFCRVGGSQEIRSDFRLLTATHKLLADQVKKGLFREDLFFRIQVYQLRVPPLRERGDDVLLLAQHFIAEHCRLLQRPAPALGADVMAALRTYVWPGGVRELQNVVQQSLLDAGETATLRIGDLPEALRELRVELPRSATPPTGLPRATLPLFGNDGSPLTLEQLEQLAIEAALARNGDNPTKAAAELGIGRATLYRKIK